MMKAKHILITLFCALVFAGCELDYYPTAAISTGTATVESLVAGMYNGVQSDDSKFIAEDVLADNLKYAGSWFTTVDQGFITSTEDYVSQWWNRYNTNIALCNNIIEMIDEQGTPDHYKGIRGEACILRAWNLYRFTSLFGEVPIILTRKMGDFPRKPEVEVWGQIKTDLEYGMANAPDFSSFVYASKEAAKALLARVLLIAPEGVRDKVQAAQYAEEMIADGTFKLADNFADVFWTSTSSEMILAWNNTVNDNVDVGWLLRSTLVDPDPNHDHIAAGRYELAVDTSLINAFEPGDQRKDVSVRSLSVGEAVTRDAVKYPANEPGKPNPVVRIAEMYLVSAEAQGYPTGVARLNELRAKRGLPALVVGTDITADNFMWKIMAERRVELCFEGHRYYDLRRWFYSGEQGKQDVLKFRVYQSGEAAGSRPTASETMQIFTFQDGIKDGYNLLLPIPALAIQQNPEMGPNNPGY